MSSPDDCEDNAQPGHRASRRITMIVATVAALAAVTVGFVQAYAAGGTAVPPLPGAGTIPFLWVAPPPIGDVRVTQDLGALQAFTVVGFLQSATVSDAKCPGVEFARQGGTAVVNGLTIIIPCHSIVQMPAATFPWSALFDTPSAPGAAPVGPIAPVALLAPPTPVAPLDLAGTSSGKIAQLPSTEVTIIGNIVSGVHIAGLVFISQQSLNAGIGTIVDFDYANGAILIAGRGGDAAQTRLQINDSRGRFTKGQTADARFNVDDENPTVRAVTGYPMCVPRRDPATGDDARCPQRNRPKVASGCRTFAADGVFLPNGRDLPVPAAGQIYCPAFVMPDPARAGATEPLSTEQAPLEIGDVITFSGTLHRDPGKGKADVYSVHTLEANVGIFTSRGTLPAYIAIGEARIGAEFVRFFNTVPQEPPDRVAFDAMTTDVTSIVDLYLVDLDPVTGAESQRWVTPFAMTGGRGSVASGGRFIDGGITTQFTGPVPGRVRMRANKAIPGLLISPTRYIRAVLRTLCDPGNINGLAPRFDIKPTAAPEMVPCLERAVSANQLKSGQFLAPMADFLFAEALIAGDPTVPNALWTLGFLVNGEGAAKSGSSGASASGLLPTPW